MLFQKTPEYRGLFFYFKPDTENISNEQIVDAMKKIGSQVQPSQPSASKPTAVN